MLKISIYDLDKKLISSAVKHLRSKISAVVYDEIHKFSDISNSDIDKYFSIEISLSSSYYNKLNNNLVLDTSISTDSALVLFFIKCVCSSKPDNRLILGDKLTLFDNFDGVDITPYIDPYFKSGARRAINSVTAEKFEKISINVGYDCVLFKAPEGVLELHFTEEINNDECNKLEAVLTSAVNNYNSLHERPISFFERLGQKKARRKQLWFLIDLGGASEDAIQYFFGVFKEFGYIKKVVLR